MAQNATELRRETLISIRDYEAQMDALIATYIADIERASLAYSDRPKTFERVSIGIIAAFLIAFERLSINANRVVASNYAAYVQNLVGQRLTKAGAVSAYSSLSNTAIRYPQNVANTFLSRRNPYDGLTFHRRIVTLQKGSERIVNGLLNIGIADGRSVNQVARAIQGYIDPRSQAGTRFTSGSTLNYRAIQAGKKLPKGSIRYNAVRIGRSEIMQTYDRAANAFFSNKKWSKGWSWHLSNTHSKRDECDNLAENSPHKRQPDRPHPQCVCDVRPVVLTVNELSDLVFAGVLT